MRYCLLPLNSEKETRLTAEELLFKTGWFNEIKQHSEIAKQDNFDKAILSNVIAHTKLWSL